MIRYKSLSKKFEKCRNRHFLWEAVVQPEEYINNIIEKIDNIYDILKREKYNLKYFCKDLNKHFKKNKIDFVADKEIKKAKDVYISYGINEGATLPDRFGRIRIYFNELALNIFKSDKIFNKFKEMLTVCLKHELIHRGQALRISDRKLRAKVLKKDYDDIIKYLSDKQEIMSFAWEIIELLRIKGLKNKEILSLIKSDIKQLRRINEIIDIYFEYFSIEDYQIKLLLKYMYMYLEDF